MPAKSEFTLNMLATELSVTRRTIERQIVKGLIVPTRYVKGSGYRKRGHWLFSAEYVEALKCRANEARSRGSSYVMAHTTSIGTTNPPEENPEQSAAVWARKTLWKRRNVMRRSSQEDSLTSALNLLLG